MAETTPKIVIVDDDLSFREALVGITRAYGFATQDFASAEELLESDALRDAACLITDVQMPGMTGLELQEALVTSGSRTPIIVVTSFPDARTRERALALGAVAVLGKPFDRDEMLSTIRLAIERRHDHATAGRPLVKPVGR